jgi:hypothetical protein
MAVGRPAVQEAQKVLKRGIPDLVRAVEDGRIRVWRAAEIAEADKTEQVALLQDHLAGPDHHKGDRKKGTAGAKPDRKARGPAGSVASPPERPAPSLRDRDGLDDEPGTTEEDAPGTETLRADVGEDRREPLTPAGLDPARDATGPSVPGDGPSASSPAWFMFRVNEFGDLCRVLAATAPGVIESLEGGMSKRDRHRLRQSVSQARAALEQVEAPLERTKDAEHGGKD